MYHYGSACNDTVPLRYCIILRDGEVGGKENKVPMIDSGETTLSAEQLVVRRREADGPSEELLPPRPGAQLRLHVLASGSKGNCSVIENAATGESIVVDCGISKRAFMAGLAECGVDVAGVQAILVTHEHSDHTKCLGVVTRGLAKAGVQPVVYASRAVHAASRELQSIQDAVDLRYFASGDDLTFGGVAVHAFPTLHDAAESFGFRFDCGGDSVGFMTDTGIVTGEAFEVLRGCRVLALESNHDPRMLEVGPYPRYLKDRIASDHGHLSNEQSADLLDQLLDTCVERVVGMHVSENNNTYALPRQSLSQVLARNDHPAHAFVGYQNRVVSV